MYSGQFRLLAQKDKENKKDDQIPSSPPHLFRRQKKSQETRPMQAEEKDITCKDFPTTCGKIVT
jgi:hypothetical protein